MLSDYEIQSFVAQNDERFSGKLSAQYNYSRVVSLANFANGIQRFGISRQEKVGIVSGYPGEPELKFLTYDDLVFLNFESDNKYDLDKDWSEYPPQQFSFTMCNQVLEHVFDPQVAFKNICHMTRPGGYIYVSIPTINAIHGEPYFYSSGFHPRYLERLGASNNLEMLDLGWWGSKKYLLNAVLGRWLTQRELKRGIRQLADIKMGCEVFFDGTSSDSNRAQNPIITDCWALFRKC